ncbi:MAG TPA: 16S rRNA (cytosine(1402)-N(4))-methyltransferase RsmH [Bacteroidales bacterium]|nr:16S rRNA (cytosine(1402)-N(4))-methyltransferase RsmH [Bacteroidales bacterium]
MSDYHTPVLLDESVSALAISPGGVYVDATFGGGGHSREILSRMDKKSRLIAFDRDEEALKNAPDDYRLTLINNNFRFIRNFIRLEGYEYVDGIICDLGVSSHQFDTGERGFSFRYDAPLDMRMSSNSKLTAADVVNAYSEEEMETLFADYGEVENSKKVANLICKYRTENTIMTTTDLNKAIEPLIPRFNEYKYLAKIYQALRIEVNGEMRALEGFLHGALFSLKKGGRVVIITYHSLEDRMVKNFLKSGNISGLSERDFFGNILSPFKVITKKPIIPSETEVASNARARSAKLRVGEKM